MIPIVIQAPTVNLSSRSRSLISTPFLPSFCSYHLNNSSYHLFKYSSYHPSGQGAGDKGRGGSVFLRGCSALPCPFDRLAITVI